MERHNSQHKLTNITEKSLIKENRNKKKQENSFERDNDALKNRSTSKIPFKTINHETQRKIERYMVK